MHTECIVRRMDHKFQVSNETIVLEIFSQAYQNLLIKYVKL